MLSFDSNLSNALKNSNTTSFWVLKLYYNDDSTASNFIGVSDIDRSDGSDFYYGIVSSWGNYSQSLDFFNFTTSTSNITIKLINVNRSIQGKRFSDLVSTLNFGNRKWELFLNTNQADTFDTAARMLGTGVISGDIKYNYDNITFTLLDKSSKVHQKLPTSTLGNGADIPLSNRNKPIPMTYGDFYTADVGTIPTTHFDRMKPFYKSAFPAIITNKFDVSAEKTLAQVDSQAVHTLDAENIYYYKNNKYANVTGSTTISSNPTIGFADNTCKMYVPLTTTNFSTSGTGSQNNVANMVNGLFNDSATGFISTTDGNTRSIFFGVPKVPKIGSIVAITAIAKLGTVVGSGPVSNLTIGASSFAINTVGGITGNDEIEANVNYTTDQINNSDLEGTLQISITSASSSGNAKVEIVEVGLVIELNIDGVEPYSEIEYYETTLGEAVREKMNVPFFESFNNEITLTRTKTINYPVEYEFVYVCGRGRKYGAFIDADSRNNGYDENQVLQNPIYIIEDILRTELSLTSSDIDFALFDTAGNDTNGEIKKPFNEDDTRDIKFAFSQYKFINSKDLIFRIGRQSFNYFWISGDGKCKIRTLLRPSDTFTVNKSIDYNTIFLKSISKTKLDSVRNKINVHYNYDYGSGQNTDIVTSNDSTSQGTTVNGNNQTLILNLEAEAIIDETTATQLADGYKSIFKDRKIMLEFDVQTPVYNDLEITDHINFTNWDDNLKLYGTAYNSDIFMITQISKRINGCTIKAIKVDA
tara:strand:- start:1037 stop:3307 length:2271 start_codon:yes stop_codon:yes gene_type:complete